MDDRPRFDVDMPVKRSAIIMGQAGPIGTVVPAAGVDHNPAPQPVRGPGISGPGLGV